MKLHEHKYLVWLVLPILLFGSLVSISMAYDISFSNLFSLVVGLLVYGGYSYLACIQFNQTIQTRDFLTTLRILILAILLVSILTFIPSLVYQYVRLIGMESELLRYIVNITGRISSVCNLIILIAIFRYRIKEGE